MSQHIIDFLYSTSYFEHVGGGGKTTKVLVDSITKSVGVLGDETTKTLQMLFTGSERDCGSTSEVISLLLDNLKMMFFDRSVDLQSLFASAFKISVLL